jgi:hypothetical protein
MSLHLTNIKKLYFKVQGLFPAELKTMFRLPPQIFKLRI